ncbi:MAG: TolC family protein [Bacteroidales bacterium]
MERHLLLCIAFILCSCFPLKAQDHPDSAYTETFTYFNPLEEDIESHLPSLQALIDSAKSHSPLLQYKDAAAVISRLHTRSERRQWSKHLGLIADARYGLFDHLILTQDDPGEINTGAVSLTRQSRYSAGIYIKLPLQEIYDRKNRVRIAREEEKMAELDYETEKMALRKLVIRQYNELITAQQVLRVKNEFIQDVLIQKEMAEQQFKTNEIDISEMTRLNSMYSKARTEFAHAKGEFNIAYLMLQEITGIKFKLKIRDKP